VVAAIVMVALSMAEKLSVERCRDEKTERPACHSRLPKGAKTVRGLHGSSCKPDRTPDCAKIQIKAFWQAPEGEQGPAATPALATGRPAAANPFLL
jgi:hypothetical protein